MDAEPTLQFEDRLLRCSSCFRDYIFSAGEAEHYHRVGMIEDGKPWPDPIRCKTCQAKRKARRLTARAPHSNDWRRVDTR